MTTERSLKPYPPAGSSFVDTSSSGGAVAISWKNRNRLILAVRKQTAPTETLEAGQTTTVRIYKLDNTLLRTASGLTGTTYSYTDDFEIADAGALQVGLVIKIKSARAGYESVDITLLVQRADFVIAGSDDVYAGADRVIL